MDRLIVVGVALVTLYVVQALVSTFMASWRYARRAAEFGCKPPPQRREKLPLGLDYIWALMKADREYRLPQEILKTYQETGHTTFAQHLLGTENIITSDPKNVQAVLALQFKDFELGERRRKNFYPLLGEGIFTLDGKGLVRHVFLIPVFSNQTLSLSSAASCI